MIKVSVIVPVYNMSALLRRCLASLRKQTLVDVEFLLVDDGSIDDSGRICEEFAALDKRFKVFHKANGGVASARELGHTMASGEYVIHCDPDDWVDPEWLENLYLFAVRSNADIVISDYYDETSRGRKVVCNRLRKLDSQSVFIDIGLINVWNSMYCFLIRRLIINKYDIHFPMEMRRCEDGFFLRKLYCNDLKTAYLSKAYYHYCHDNEKSLSYVVYPEGYAAPLLDKLQAFPEPYRTVGLSTLTAHAQINEALESLLHPESLSNSICFREKYQDLYRWVGRIKFSYTQRVVLFGAFYFSPVFMAKLLQIKAWFRYKLPP